MNIRVRVQDLLLLLWKKKYIIIGLTLLMGLLSVPLAYTQHQYSQSKYDELLLETKTKIVADTFGVGEAYGVAEAFILIKDLSGNADEIPLNEIAQIMKSEIVQSAAIRGALGKDSISVEDRSFYLEAMLQTIQVTSYQELQFIYATCSHITEEVFEALVSSMLSEALDILAPVSNFTYSYTYQFEVSKEAQSTVDYMQITEKPNSYVRIIGTAAVLGFALICIVILFIDLFAPVIKGKEDIAFNFKIPVVEADNLCKYVNGRNCNLYSKRKTRKIKKLCQSLKNEGITFSDAGSEDLSIIFVKLYSTPYEYILKIMGINPEAEVILVVL